MDINKCSIDELRSLKGVGKVIASRIINARNEKLFASKEDLINRVRGITLSLLNDRNKNIEIVFITEKKKKSASKKAKITKKLDINKCSIDELRSLKGVGQHIATRIINARNETLFTSKEDLINRVRGITLNLLDGRNKDIGIVFITGKKAKNRISSENVSSQKNKKKTRRNIGVHHQTQKYLKKTANCDPKQLKEMNEIIKALNNDDSTQHIAVKMQNLVQEKEYSNMCVKGRKLAESICCYFGENKGNLFRRIQKVNKNQDSVPEAALTALTYLRLRGNEEAHENEVASRKSDDDKAVGKKKIIENVHCIGKWLRVRGTKTSDK